MSSLMKFQYGLTIFQFQSGGSYPARRTFQVNQVQDRTAAGTLQVEDVGIRINTRYITFERMPKADYLGLIDWFLNVVNAGEKEFEFTDEYGDTGTVKITDNILDFREVSLERYSGTITLEYV